ncbi:UPF0047-domain-containing protein [Aspergillus ambiguus]|uniref:UPF0047-domain-containing protein n=1 Tax=Aspergillus ambiguus TaxID=176160 RepID=UPI003CCD894C
MADDIPTEDFPLPNPHHSSFDERWRHRPPYRIQTPEEFGPVKWEGHCHCGHVSFKINRERPLKTKFCHCQGCQLLHGAPFQWAAIFHKSDISFCNGSKGLSFFSSSEMTTHYTNPTKVSCAFCHTPIMDEGRNVCLLFPPSVDRGRFPEEQHRWREAFAVDCHIFYSSRVVDIPDGKPKWSGLDGSTQPATAATRITDNEMNSLLHRGGAELADRYAPMWFFGEWDNHHPCYPTWAFSGSPSAPDVYDDAHKTPPAKQCEYPDVGCRCRNPGVDRGHAGPAFPIYYTYQKCNDTEVRVVYNLFYEKDGAEVLDIIDTGHDYDWERVIVIHSRDEDNMWAPSRALLSSHSGYHSLAWADIHNTLSTDEVHSTGSKPAEGGKDRDHPKVYVAWSKHAQFDTTNTLWVGPIAQSTDNAFRSDDWWHYVDRKNYIQSDNSTQAGQALGRADWGPHNPNKMSWFQKNFTLPARSRGSYLITDHVLSEVPEIRDYKVGMLNLFVQHTSCALSLNENWDDDVRADMSDALDRIAPYDRKGNLYRHSAEGEDDMPAHIKSALIGASVNIPISNGRLATGTWQGIWYLEFRTSRHARKVVATIQGEKA